MNLSMNRPVVAALMKARMITAGGNPPIYIGGYGSWSQCTISWSWRLPLDSDSRQLLNPVLWTPQTFHPPTPAEGNEG